MRLVFMGTPDFVAPILDDLAEASSVELAGVYTPPDRPGGRGRADRMPPVKVRALELGLKVHQPVSFRSSQAQAELASLQPDVIVVAAYGKLLPPAVLEAAPHGCLNLHPSLLPSYRGPSPVSSAIVDGLEETGVTLMLLDEGMDTGPVIARRTYPVLPDDTAETLTASLFKFGSELLLESLGLWVEGQLTAEPQDHSAATVTRKLERNDGLADWNLPAAALRRRQRAYTPWPGLFTNWQGRVLKLLEVEALSDAFAPGGGPPGLAVALSAENGAPDGPGKHGPVGVITGDGVLALKTLQLEGRRPLRADEFLRGHHDFMGSQL